MLKIAFFVGSFLMLVSSDSMEARAAPLLAASETAAPASTTVRQTEEADAFAALTREMGAAAAEAKAGKPVDWRRLYERFDAHVRRYAGMPVLHQRAQEFIVMMMGPDPMASTAPHRQLKREQWSALNALKITPERRAQRKALAAAAWAELEGGPDAGYKEASAKYGEGTKEFYLWWAKQRMDYRTKSLTYSVNFWDLGDGPGSVRLCRALLATWARPPFFWEDDEQGAAAYAAGTPERAVVDMTLKETYALRAMTIRPALLRSAAQIEDWTGLPVSSVEELRAELQVLEHLQTIGEAQLALKRGDYVDLVPLARNVVDHINSPALPVSRGLDLARALLQATGDLQVSHGVISVLKNADKPEIEAYGREQEIAFLARIESRSAAAAPAAETDKELSNETDGDVQAVKEIPEDEPARLHAKSVLGQPAPDFEVEKWLGQEPQREGKFLLVDFWATWCEPCRKSIPKLNALHHKFGDRLVVVGISDEPEATVRQFNAKRGAAKATRIEFPQALDSRKRMMRALEITGIPHVILIDPQGIVRWEGPPWNNPDFNEQRIADILAAGIDSAAAQPSSQGL